MDWVFVRYGINDRARLDNFAKEFPDDFRELIGLLQKHHPSAQIVLMTVIPFSAPEASQEMNAHVRAVTEQAELPVFDIYPRYASELEDRQNMLNYRRYALDKVPENYHALVAPFVHRDQVVVMSNELDAILRGQ